MPGRIFSREFKINCCQQIETGQKRPAQVCREHSLGEGLLLRWRNEYKERGGEQAFTLKEPAALSQTQALEKRIAALECHCGHACVRGHASVPGQLWLENALLKKLAAASRSNGGTK